MYLLNFCLSRRFQTAGLSFSGHSFNLPLVNRNISGDTIGFEGSRTEKTHAAHYHVESRSTSEWLTLSDLFRAVKIDFSALPSVNTKFLLHIFCSSLCKNVPCMFAFQFLQISSTIF